MNTTITEFAAYAGVKPVTVYRWIKAGKLPRPVCSPGLPGYWAGMTPAQVASQYTGPNGSDTRGSRQSRISDWFPASAIPESWGNMPDVPNAIAFALAPGGLLVLEPSGVRRITWPC